MEGKFYEQAKPFRISEFDGMRRALFYIARPCDLVFVFPGLHFV
jgi:hypothetical protein